VNLVSVTQPASMRLHPSADDLDDAQDQICAQLLQIRYATTSDLGPAWYDTAQVVRTWARHPGTLPEAVGRSGLDTLLRTQHPDGSWGYTRAPGAYRVVPTLAATTALTAVGAQLSPVTAARAAAAADAAVAFIASDAQQIAPHKLPDTIAVEFIVPALLETLEQELPTFHPAHNGIRAALRLHDAALGTLRRHRAAAHAGVTLPAASHYSLEVLGQPPAGYRHSDFMPDGHLACSPAATAAALSWSNQPCGPAVDYLIAEGKRLGGAWPTVAPVTVFEAGAIVSAAARAGMRLAPAVAAHLGPWLAAQITADGCGAGAALAPDSDDTAIVMFALHALGHPWSPHPLFAYEQDTHFATFPGERTLSCSTNAHVLEVLRAAAENGHRDHNVALGIGKTTRYLLDTQHADGHWDDKWHASPFYATATAVLALHGDEQPHVRAAVDRAITWVIQQQRSGGSWGGWSGTREETTYALQVLLATGANRYLPGHRDALAGGLRFLADAVTACAAGGDEAPLWHGKELYAPRRLVDMLALITLEAGQLFRVS
jgi:halimadienyl-diphosphate synthase